MSIPYTHEQNGVAERAIHTITEGPRAMLYASKLLMSLWSIAVKTMAYLHNRSPTRANNSITLLERITSKKPDLTHLRVFGSPVSIAVPKEKRKKWDNQSRMGYMVGYEPYLSGYLIWYPRAQCMEKARDVFFHEDTISPAVPMLYGNDNTLHNVSKGIERMKTAKTLPPSPVKPKFTI